MALLVRCCTLTLGVLMLQYEMFGNRHIGTYLGAGAYSSAHLMTNGLVCKVGRNDGTRNWLEFCLLEREAGRLLPLMPEVFTVAAIAGGRYMAVMRKYEGMADCDNYAGYKVQYHPNFDEVVKRYGEYMLPVVGNVPWYYLFTDLHGGNTMMCGERDVVITDPSAGEYVKQGHCPDFELAYTVH